jgi:two-component system KDP operon response regulator KdpE
MKVLVINGSREETRNIHFSLQLRWPECIILAALEGSKAVSLIETESPDLVILDFNSSDIDGLDIVEKIRSFCDVPIIVITIKDNEMSGVSCLELGADEFITKPYNPIELLAKVVALLRRAGSLGIKRPQEPLSIGNLMVNFTTREVFCSGNRIKLTPIEYNLLSYLVRNEGKVLTHAALMERIWGQDYIDDLSFIKKYIYRLRSKLHDDAQNPKMIINERGVGYRFVRPS